VRATSRKVYVVVVFVVDLSYRGSFCETVERGLIGKEPSLPLSTNEPQLEDLFGCGEDRGRY